MNITHYCDPGHGWMKVSKELLIKLGIEKQITAWSFERGEYAYLEEDCDASLLLKTLDLNKIEWKIKTSHTNKRSRIRNYKRFNFEG